VDPPNIWLPRPPSFLQIVDLSKKMYWREVYFVLNEHNNSVSHNYLVAFTRAWSITPTI
jgi:hypothetical protein